MACLSKVRAPWDGGTTCRKEARREKKSKEEGRANAGKQSGQGGLTDLVQMQDISDLVQIDVREVSARSRERHAAALLVLDAHVGPLAVDANAHGVQLHGQQLLLDLGLT